jgi:hypothetical protein
VVFDSVLTAAKNGVLVLTSITGRERRLTLADRIHLAFVSGNTVMVGRVNASRAHVESGVRDMAHAGTQDPGWLRRLLTDRVSGLGHSRDLFARPRHPGGATTIVCEVAAS